MASVETPPVPARPLSARPAVRAVAGVAIVALLGYIAVQGWSLYQQLRGLQDQQERINRTNVVGYLNIHAEPSNAHHPADWYHHDGDQTFLWAGWKDGKHDWFRIGKGELAQEEISLPMGRDIIRAIDRTIIERSGGPRWGKVPDAALVVGLRREGGRVVYPMLVLSKVEVVNDQIGEEPVLVIFRPFVPEREAVSAWSPVVDGHRITMGVSGYFIDRTPVLYDRGTRSLWHARDGSLVAIGGPLKGTTLRAVEGLEVRPWSDWRSRYPDSRLVVGADRSKPRPEL
jgi:hypothetical protein